jgi:hypothetical protein
MIINGTFISAGFQIWELAQLYFPKISKHSATIQFRRWIRLNEKLQEELKVAGHMWWQKLLTPKQVEITIHFIGEP